MKKETIEKCYVYLGKKVIVDRDMKIGESANMKTRTSALWSDERVKISRYVTFEGTKADRLFVESHLRIKYDANCNLHHYGNDHFHAQTRNNLKGAENRFFEYVGEALAELEKIKRKDFPYKTHIGEWDRAKEFRDMIDSL